MQAPAILVTGLSKEYKLYRRPSDVLLDAMGWRRFESLWALNDVSFELSAGEVVGVVGHNGSGKSTLLRILAGTLDPTRGSVRIRGRVSAILELGTGFLTENTGRQNIYAGGVVLGMTRDEINEKLDQIVDFSGLREFIDQPFRTYSSGMQARLTFSVAISVNPEILLIDEALAVGDNFFVARCLERITDLCRSGATVVIVSHSLFLLQRLCRRAVWLDRGRARAIGPVNDVCQAYEAELIREHGQSLLGINKAIGPGAVSPVDSAADRIYGTDPGVAIAAVTFSSPSSPAPFVYFQGEALEVRIAFTTARPLRNPAVYVAFTRADGVLATSVYSGEERPGSRGPVDLGEADKEGTFSVTFDPLWLGIGDYLVTVGIYPSHGSTAQDYVLEPLAFHDKRYKIGVKRRGRQVGTVFEQPAEVRLEGARPALERLTPGSVEGAV